MTDEFFDALKTGGVAGVLKKYRPVEEEIEEAKAEIARLNLENTVYAQKLDDATHEIARITKLMDEMDKIVEAFIYRVQPRKDVSYDEQIEKAKYLH